MSEEEIQNITIPRSERPVHEARDVLAYVHFVIGSYILVANSLVVMAVYKYDYLRTRANIYIVSLALTDICVGLMEYIIGLHNHTILVAWFDRTGWACVSMFSFAFFSVACSMFNMVLIAMDRLIYIMKPFFYQREVTSNRVKMTVGCVWILAFAWGTIPLYIHTYDSERAICSMQAAIPSYYRAYMNVPLLVLGALTTGVAYIIIARTAIQHKKAIRKTTTTMGGPMAGLSDAAEKKAMKTMKSNMKTLKLFIIVFGLLIICWAPYYFIEFTGDFIDIPDSLYRASTALGFLNSGMNFIVYPMYNMKFRRALRSMVCPCLPELKRHGSELTYSRVTDVSVFSKVTQVTTYSALPPLPASMPPPFRSELPRSPPLIRVESFTSADFQKVEVEAPVFSTDIPSLEISQLERVDSAVEYPSTSPTTNQESGMNVAASPSLHSHASLEHAALYDVLKQGVTGDQPHTQKGRVTSSVFWTR